jgi:hypothetical protein
MYHPGGTEINLKPLIFFFTLIVTARSLYNLALLLLYFLLVFIIFYHSILVVLDFTYLTLYVKIILNNRSLYSLAVLLLLLLHFGIPSREIGMNLTMPRHSLFLT